MVDLRWSVLMMGGDRDYALVIAATALAVATAAVLAFVPLTTTVSTSAVPPDEAGVEASRQSLQRVERQNLAEAQGWAEVARIGAPLVVVAAMPLVAPSGRRARILRTVSTALLFLGAAVAILSFGVFVLPSAALMLIAAARSGRPSETNWGSSRPGHVRCCTQAAHRRAR